MSFKSKQGHYNCFGEHIGDNGYTIDHDTPMGSINYWVETIEEVEAALKAYDPDAIHAQAQAISDYLTSDEGAWGR